MERPAFDRLLTEMLPRIEGSALSYATGYGLRDEWQDISQTALLKMLRFADKYDPDKGELMPWACVVIFNTIKNRIAQIATMPATSEINTLIIERAQAGHNPETDLQTSLILDNLNEEARLCVEGYTCAEIAARCGYKSKSYASARVKQCAYALRHILNGTTPPKIRRGRPPRNICA